MKLFYFSGSMISVSFLLIIFGTISTNILKHVQNENAFIMNKDFWNVVRMPNLTIYLLILFTTVQFFLGQWDFDTFPFIMTLFSVLFLIKLYNLVSFTSNIFSRKNVSLVSCL